MTTEEKQPAVFKKLGDLRPDTAGHNLTVKVGAASQKQLQASREGRAVRAQSKPEQPAGSRLTDHRMHLLFRLKERPCMLVEFVKHACSAHVPPEWVHSP